MIPCSPTPNPSPVSLLVCVYITPDEDWRQISLLATTNKTYPVPIAYGGAGTFDNPGLYGVALWLDKTDVLDGSIHRVTPGFITGGIPL